LTFPEKTGDERGFVEEIWARRKVGFLLDQIRANGEKKELKDEVIVLAKKYGITTPYTSWLIVPDGPVPVVRGPGGPRPGFGFGGGGGLAPGTPPPAVSGPTGGAAKPVTEFAKEVQGKGGEIAHNRDRLQSEQLQKLADDAKGDKDVRRMLDEAKAKKDNFDGTRKALEKGEANYYQLGRSGVDLAINSANLRNQCRLEQTAQRNVYGRNCVEI